MNAIMKTEKNGIRHRAVLGSLFLSCAASAFGQVPAAPHIDWIELDDNRHAVSDFAELYIGWSHYDLQAVTSIQYRLDGIPVMTRAVGEDQSHGENVFSIDHDGPNDLTMALCNAYGCGVTSPVSISMTDIDVLDSSLAGTDTSAWRAEIKRELERIRANTEMLDYVYGSPHPQLSAGHAAMGSGLISALGKATLSGLVRGGADFAFLALMEHMGMASDDFGSQIDQLQSSMDTLNTQVANLTSAIEALHDETTWQGFLNQHKDANIAVNLIYANFGHVTAWMENGIEVDEIAWTNARRNISDSLTILAGARLNASGGIVDSQHGAIYQLMNAIPQRVASVDSYWPLVDEYRDYYRAALAIGFLGLDLIADAFDGSGTTRVMADDALHASQRAVLATYAYGIAPMLPVSHDFVQLRGSVDGYAARTFAQLDDSATDRLAGPLLRSAFAQMADDYRPNHHNGLTLEAFLSRSSVPTGYILDNTGGWKSTGWQVDQVSPGKPHLGQPPTYRLKPLVGRVVGNAWVETYETFCSTGPCMPGADIVAAMNESQIQAMINERKSIIRSRGGYWVNNWTYLVSHYGAINLTDRLNHAGRAAEFDADAILFAAFGDADAD